MARGILIFPMRLRDEPAPRLRPTAAGPRGVAIEVGDLRHTYRVRGRTITVLDGLQLSVPPGGYASLSGPSGAGKTTLLSLVGGLEPPQSGSLMVGGTDLRLMSRDELAAYRRRTVGFVFQHFGLIETLSARENVEFARALTSRRGTDRSERANDLLRAVGIGDRALHRPAELSGGERQRVAMARALANDPGLVLADEPTGNLDEASSIAVIELLEALRVERGVTLLVVTHHRELASRADDRYAFAGGRLVRA
jgi:putative ABC transport system ATP-binding protein